MDSDAYAIRKAVEMGLPLFVSNSFENLSLYGERVGGLSAVCPNKEEAELVFGQLKFTVRRIYSSPAAHGAYIASDVMNSEEAARFVGKRSLRHARPYPCHASETL